MSAANLATTAAERQRRRRQAALNEARSLLAGADRQRYSAETALARAAAEWVEAVACGDGPDARDEAHARVLDAQKRLDQLEAEGRRLHAAAAWLKRLV